MWSFGAFCDEFQVNSRLSFKLELAPSRESLLHFFEQVRRRFPDMTRFRRQDNGACSLETERQESRIGHYVKVDAHSVKLGCYQPHNLESVTTFADCALTLAPPHLSLSDLDYDFIECIYAFDLEYRGNHDELVAEALMAEQPLLRALASEQQRVIDCQPFCGVALNTDCTRQAYLEIKGRTSSFEVRTGTYEPVPLSVYLTVRQYWRPGLESELIDVHRELLQIGEHIVAQRLLAQVVQPLAAEIASRS